MRAARLSGVAVALAVASKHRERTGAPSQESRRTATSLHSNAGNFSKAPTEVQQALDKNEGI